VTGSAAPPPLPTPSAAPRALPAGEPDGAAGAAPAVIAAVRPGRLPDPWTGQATVEIEIATEHRFDVRDERLVLRVGDAAFRRSRFRADLRRVVFVLTADEFAGLAEGAPVSLGYGSADAAAGWEAGTFAR
jgi:hypothetical protein